MPRPTPSDDGPSSPASSHTKSSAILDQITSFSRLHNSVLGPDFDRNSDCVHPPDSIASAQLPPHQIPERTSSKRKVPWNEAFRNMSTEELHSARIQAQAKIFEARKKLKRQTSMDAEYWKNYSQVFQIHQKEVGIESELALQSFKTRVKTQTENEWHHSAEADEFNVQLRGWQQFDSLAKKHLAKLERRLETGRETWVRLFATSKLGLSLCGSVRRRNSSHQSNFVAAMMEAYCPSPPSEYYRWDPVLQVWGDGEAYKAAHLFPWRQIDSMDDIFGKGASIEIFSAVNGLFLHSFIEDSLNKGLIAIVPDVDLEPRNPNLPQDNQDERQQRIREWESQPIKEFKVVVVNKLSPVVTKIRFAKDQLGVATLMDLHNRRLVFKTDFRPRARYIWWTFLNTILRTAWNAKINDDNVQHVEVRKATRYWGTRGPYVKENQLLGFIEELGQDVNSILDFAINDEGDKEPSSCGVTVAVFDAIERSLQAQVKDEDEDEEEDEDEADWDQEWDWPFGDSKYQDKR